MEMVLTCVSLLTGTLESLRLTTINVVLVLFGHVKGSAAMKVIAIMSTGTQA